ncbi:MAG: hypothetical protein OCD02_12045 [Spirochaetaceae bacterium]
MKLKILDSVNDLLEKVKVETGKEVLIFENNQVSSMVEAKTARESDKNHFIAYSPDYTPEINHLIAAKALQFLRIYKESPENRKIAVAYQEHLNNARMSIALESKDKPHLEVVLNDAQLTSTWVLSLINQLISQPVSINIERYIYNNFPELREFQKNVVSAQFKDFNLTLSPEVERLSPNVIYNSSAIMNYVYLNSIDDIAGTTFIQELNYIVKKRKCEKLYEYTKDNLKDSIVSDNSMIDYWADFFKISEWYTWTSFESVGETNA